MTKFIPNAFNFAVIVYVAIGSIALPYSFAGLTSIIGQPSFYTSFGLAPHGFTGNSHTSHILGALNRLSSAGTTLGAAFCAWPADKFGRKLSIQAASLIMIVGAALCTGAVDVEMLMVARFIVGWAAGMKGWLSCNMI